EYLDKKVTVHLNGSRRVTGTFTGYDVFLNVTLSNALEYDSKGNAVSIGSTVIRGSSIVSVE
ncbi:putative small nuclear ribonucleo protein G (snRNP-G), partial [Metschnikowia bicuspidata]